MDSLPVINVIMPRLGLTMQEGTIVRWLKQDGERVAVGDILSVIETEKITHEIEAQKNGLLQILAPEGATLSTGEPIGRIVSAVGSENPVASSSPYTGDDQSGTQHALDILPVEMLAEKPARKREISPVALRMAQHFHLDLAQVVGSGSRGRVHKADILNALQRQQQQPLPAVASGSAQEAFSASRAVHVPRDISEIHTPAPILPVAELENPESPGIAYTVEAVSPMRMRIAQHLLESLHNTAQLTLTMEADITDVISIKKQLQVESQRLDNMHVTFTHILIKVVALALCQHRRLNANLVRNELRLYSEVNVGVATALEDGLLVPVIRQADKKSIGEISRELGTLTEQVRSGAITPDNLADGTFTITNLGAFGVDYFTPILYRQQSGVLGVGSITEHRVGRKRRGKKQSTVGLSLTFDHRIVDGVPAAQFLSYVKYLLEHPWSLLLGTH